MSVYCYFLQKQTFLQMKITEKNKVLIIEYNEFYFSDKHEKYSLHLTEMKLHKK